MLLSSVLMSISTFQSRSARTLDLCTTFWSKVWRLPSSFHMQLSPPMTLTLSTLGSQLYIFLQSWQDPQTFPQKLLKPMSRQVRSQLDMITSFFLPAIRLTFELTPHQSMTSSSSMGRSISSFAQQITFLDGEMPLQTPFCRYLQQTDKPKQSLMLWACIHSRMLGLSPQQSQTTSSPPKWTQSSSKVELTQFMTSVTSYQVKSRVGSNWPIQMPLQMRVMSLYFSLLPQDCVWAGVSISGITRIPLILAYSMTDLMSYSEKTPPTLPNSLNSGTLGTSIGKESSSMMCQCSTFNLEQSIESMALLMVVTGRQCLEVSIISPLHLKSGTSLIAIGRPTISY